jgi:uncharacterized protein YjcR
MRKNTREKSMKVSVSDLSKEFGFPSSTIKDWRNSNGWRKDVYWILRSCTKAEISSMISEGQRFSEEYSNYTDFSTFSALVETFNIPMSTLKDWRSSNTWRKTLYWFLQGVLDANNSKAIIESGANEALLHLRRTTRP